jgi:hypothetical protein
MTKTMEMRMYENSKRDVAEGIGPVMRRLFATEDGMALLRYFLYEWGWYSVCSTPEQMAMRNYAAKFLNELGNFYGVEVRAVITPESGDGLKSG